MLILRCILLLGDIARENGGSDFIWEKDHEARAKLWKARHEFWYAALATAPGKKVRNTHYLNNLK